MLWLVGLLVLGGALLLRLRGLGVLVLGLSLLSGADPSQRGLLLEALGGEVQSLFTASRWLLLLGIPLALVAFIVGRHARALRSTAVGLLVLFIGFGRAAAFIACTPSGAAWTRRCSRRWRASSRRRARGRSR